MNSIINSVSFGAHLNLADKKLGKYVSRNVADEFAKNTKDISGHLNLKNTVPETITAEYGGEVFEIIEKSFKELNESKMVKTLVKTLQYISEIINFNKIEDPTKDEAMAHVRKLNKIAGKNKSMSLNHELYTDMWISHFNQ